MSTLSIIVKSGRTGTDLADRLNVSSTSPRVVIQRLINTLTAVAGGVENASIDVQTASADPVAASGTITLSYADIANSDTVSVAGVTLTCVTGTPTGAQFKKVTDGATTATNLATLINSNATTSLYVYASASGAVVTVTALVKHKLGNLVALATSNATGFVLSAAALAGGTGGTTAATAPVTYAFGL